MPPKGSFKLIRNEKVIYHGPGNPGEKKHSFGYLPHELKIIFTQIMNDDVIIENFDEPFEILKNKPKTVSSMNKQYYDKKFKSQRHRCECGSVVLKHQLKRHYKSIKHQRYLDDECKSCESE